MALTTFKLVNGDIPVNNSTGMPILVSGSEKFRQDIREVIEIDAGLDSLVGLVDSPTTLRAEISRRLTSAFDRYARLQDSIQRFDRPPSETFGRLLRVDVAPLRDPRTGEFALTKYSYRVDVLSLAKTRETVSGLIVR